ncbi:MAG: DUF2007 domain-containing protein [Deltaproteobacteria bacterium]|nr:DUF2007 domain-containing protein [Deltaproteobacteria bacterium]
MSDTSESDVRPQDDNREFAVAGLANDAIEAELLVDACDEAGIDAMVAAGRSGMVDKLAAVSETFEIRVAAKDLEAAQKIIAERKEALEQDPEGWSKAAEEEAEKSTPEGT